MDDVYVYDTDFKLFTIYDSYESLIWNEHYNTVGDFELYLFANKKALDELKIGYILSIKKSERLMVIEKIELDESADGKNYIILTGRSFESVLDRRIIRSNTYFTDIPIVNILKFVVEDSIQYSDEPLFTHLGMDSFALVIDNKNDIYDIRLTNEEYFTLDSSSQNVLNIFETLCTYYGIGYKLTIDQYSRVILTLYKGTDRSINQTQFPPVIFSDKFSNLLYFKHTINTENYKNDGYCDGKYNTNESNVKYPIREYINGTYATTGVNRRETYVMAEDQDSIVINDGSVQSSEALAYIRLYAQYQLYYNNSPEETYEIEVDVNDQTFTFNKDYYIGDTVTIEDPFGNVVTMTCVSSIYSNNSSDGITLIPKFEVR